MSVFADTRPLNYPHYRRLFLAQIVTMIGAQLTTVAVPAQIYSITGSSAYVGLTGIFGLVPLVVFGLWGGALADAFNRRTLMIITTLGLSGTALLLFFQSAVGANVWVVLLIFAAQQAFFAVNQPTRGAVLARLVPTELLPAANSLNMTVMQAGAIVGPLLGGLMIPVLGYTWLYLLDAISVLVTLVAVIALPSLPPLDKGQGAGLRSVIDGFVFLAGQKVLLASFVVDLIAMVFGMARALIPQISHENFGAGDDGGVVLALLYSGMAVGAVIGGIFSGWTSRVARQGVAVIVAVIVWGATMIGFGVSVGLADGSTQGKNLVLFIAALGFLAAGGAADMISAAFRTTMLQEAATDDVRGRLQGVFVVVVAGGPRIGDVLHGVAAASAGVAVAAAGGGFLVIVGTLIAAVAIPALVRYRVIR